MPPKDNPSTVGGAAAVLLDGGVHVIRVVFERRTAFGGGGAAVSAKVDAKHAVVAGCRSSERLPERVVEPHGVQQHEVGSVAGHCAVKVHGHAFRS